MVFVSKKTEDIFVVEYPFYNAYLDIETTGLSPLYAEITVVGIYLEGYKDKIVQLIGEGITYFNLISALRGVKNIYTYNGSRFDLIFIKERLGIDINAIFNHCDLMYLCWRGNLYGGLKAVERKLGIERKLKDVNGESAIVLWERYRKFGDFQSLKLLLEYNKEDVCNLKILKKKLEEIFKKTGT
ncbi:MAG: ribonuclease H-like domain-containing protein [Synergistetes bacterium]|nr:ribonuclease H-like domain-containing protein [Synergistota bacterium]MDW8192878.1 ribonuclease H-like domain-containing protein [Synergistota bacterium]